jgi:hypothetical protein
MKKLAILIALLVISHPHLTAAAEKPLRWYGYIYGGKMVDEHFVEMPVMMFAPDTYDSSLVVIGMGKELHHFKHITIEGEAQIAKHFGNLQDHYEFNALANVRWQTFPWDRHVDTSVALGAGLSYATEKPEVEIIDMGNTSNLLVHLSLEADFLIPGQKDWSIFTRVHHRSGAFGLVNNVDGGSNALALGVKKRF